MSRCTWLFIALAAFAAGCAPAANVEQERTALMAADRAWSETTKDPEKMAAYIADGGSVYPPGMPIVTGGEAIRKMFTQMMAAPGFTLSWTATKAEVGAAGDIGYTTGSYQSTMGGVSEKGKYVTTWKKQADGAWKVTEDIFNADEAPKAPAGTHAMVAANALKWGDAPPACPPACALRSCPAIRARRSRMSCARSSRRTTASRRTGIRPWKTSRCCRARLRWAWARSSTNQRCRMLRPADSRRCPREMRHFFMSKTAATIQVHGIGPFAITYLNPADDPRTKKSN